MPPLVHGHRGCRGLRPENTLAAFRHALALGADVLELDVVVSADGQVVVSHEPWPSASFCTAPDGQVVRSGQEADFNFYRLPYASIRAFDCGQRRHPGFPEQQTGPAYKPLLREVLRAADEFCQQLGRLPVAFAVEVKSTAATDEVFHPAPARFVELVVGELTGDGVLARTTLLSFDARVLVASRRSFPALRVCLLCEAPFQVAGLFDGLGFRPEVFGPEHGLLDEAGVRALLAAYPGLELVPWTVNEPADFDRLLGWPLAGITTDYPDRLLAALGR